MPTPHEPHERMQTYRARLREQGLRPVQIWVPDVRTPDFEAKLLRQIQNLQTAHEAQILKEFLDLFDDSGW